MPSYGEHLSIKVVEAPRPQPIWRIHHNQRIGYIPLRINHSTDIAMWPGFGSCVLNRTDNQYTMNGGWKGGSAAFSASEVIRRWTIRLVLQGAHSQVKCVHKGLFATMHSLGSDSYTSAIYSSPLIIHITYSESCPNKHLAPP